MGANQLHTLEVLDKTKQDEWDSAAWEHIMLAVDWQCNDSIAIHGKSAARPKEKMSKMADKNLQCEPPIANSRWGADHRRVFLCSKASTTVDNILKTGEVQ